MSLALIIRPEAEADVLDAFAWYNEQLPGLGQELLAELDRVFAEIVANPEAFARVHRELRRALVRRFPYGIFYALETNRVVVVAILHTARSPKIWRRRNT